jgi:hypothetical protein
MRPSRTITVTLPEDTLVALSRVDPDVGLAIVRLAAGNARGPQSTGVEVVTFGSRAVIAVGRTHALSGIKGVELVPLIDGRFLIALTDDVSEAHFELAVRDALASNATVESDRALLERLTVVLQDARRTGSLVLRRIMVLQAAAGGSDGAAMPRRKRRAHASTGAITTGPGRQ